MWMQSRRDAFTFDELRDELPTVYRAGESAVDRMWSRDKLALASLGMRLCCDGRWYEVSEDSYAPRPRLTAADLATLARTAKAERATPVVRNAILKVLASDPSSVSNPGALGVARQVASVAPEDDRPRFARAASGA
jgi:hypothetical protein